MPRVGEYELHETVGRGAFSKVKLCTHQGTNEQFVAKILPIGAEVETEVRREIQILRRIVHPHVVRLKEILQSSRNYYIILEPVRGGDLCTLIMKDEHENGMPEAQVAFIFEQILSGLMACHNAGVAHRDLKPENLLLSTDGHVKITDFGLSRMNVRESAVAGTPEYATTLTGTLAYVAPEVLGRHYDPFKADIWSLGCILYVMLTGKFPFGSASGRQLEDLIRRGAWIPLSQNVSAEAQDLCNQLLVLDPKGRSPLERIREHAFLAMYLGSSHEKASTQALMSESFCDSTSAFEHVEDANVASPLGVKSKGKLPTDGNGTNGASPK